MAVEHPDRVAQAEETTIAARRIELERNYVELLERRIANLESMLNEPKSAETTEDEEEEVKRKGTKKEKQSRIRLVVAKYNRDKGVWNDTARYEQKITRECGR
ncbi:MAG: hypothetical protein M1821_009235 [Bathelium mastoideum]|nr:MAG: hypothetical protein M1821_009235 [Bathelium mastoideum]